MKRVGVSLGERELEFIRWQHHFATLPRPEMLVSQQNRQKMHFIGGGSALERNRWSSLEKLGERSGLAFNLPSNLLAYRLEQLNRDVDLPA